MSLPILCPKSENSPCSGETCPMYTTDWRYKAEYCIIGYCQAGSRKNLLEPVPAKDGLPETPVLEARTDDVPEVTSEKKQKSGDFIDLRDIPDDYEEEFWG